MYCERNMGALLVAEPFSGENIVLPSKGERHNPTVKFLVVRTFLVLLNDITVLQSQMEKFGTPDLKGLLKNVNVWFQKSLRFFLSWHI